MLIANSASPELFGVPDIESTIVPEELINLPPVAIAVNPVTPVEGIEMVG